MTQFTRAILTGAGALVATVVAACAAPRAAAAPLVRYSQDGSTYVPFGAVAGREKIKDYYDYRKYKGHPDFGSEANTTTVALYFDAKRNSLNFIAISGKNDSGKVTYRFEGIPGAAYQVVSDEPDEYKYKKGTGTTEATYRRRTSSDGLVLSGLEGTGLGIKFSVKNYKNTALLRLVDGNSFVTLDPSKPLWLKDLSVTSTPPGGGGGTPGSGPGGGVTTPPAVPEPAAGLLATGLAALLIHRRRR